MVQLKLFLYYTATTGRYWHWPVSGKIGTNIWMGQDDKMDNLIQILRNPLGNKSFINIVLLIFVTIELNCYVLFNQTDLSNHLFIFLHLDINILFVHSINIDIIVFQYCSTFYS